MQLVKPNDDSDYAGNPYIVKYKVAVRKQPSHFTM